MIKCSACGRTLCYNRVEKKGKNYSYFQCYGYSKKVCSVSHGISEQKMVSALLCSLQEAAYTGTKYRWKKREREEEIQKDAEYLMQIQLEKLAKKEERIQIAYMNGVDTLEEYKNKKQVLLKEREVLEKQISLSLLKEQNSNQIEGNELVLDIITAMKSDYFTNVEKNKAIRTIIEKIVYKKEEDMICVYYCAEKKE